MRRIAEITTENGIADIYYDGYNIIGIVRGENLIPEEIIAKGYKHVEDAAEAVKEMYSLPVWELKLITNYW